MYELIKYIHILSAITWVGSDIALQVIAIRVARSPDPMDVPKFLGHVEFLGKFLLQPAAILLVVAGILMTIQRWAFQQTWISVALVLWFVSLAAGSFFLMPQGGRAKRLFDAEGPASPAARAIVGRMFLVSRVELVTFVVIIALIVAKPNIG